MKFEKIGMRTIKTALAVSFTILLSQLLNLRSPFFAGIAAIIAMQTSVSESFTMAKNRMYGTILGGTVALLFSYFAPENVFSIGIGIIIIIYTCNLFGWKKSVQISTMVFLSIILNYEEGSRLNYALYRTLDTLIGLIIGTLINYFIVPPKVEDKIRDSIHNMYSEFKDIIESIIWGDESGSLENLRKYLADVEENYNILKKDIKLNLCKTDDCYNYDWMFNTFEAIYNHLSILFAIEKIPQLTEENKRALESLFSKEIPLPSNEKLDELDLVYNYHLKKLLKGLNSIQVALYNVQSIIE
ncbi:conserved membrane hypothetical protein [[Clostridium] ultunense Esp]|uniref:Uncharacterized protein n=1 Tax=[Clostridium] ultunense Esp TaxID=1288971 RepID=M1ZK06_9FIRM|nr:aromatic acid exporter family protein [Schnuerera ultunensis]CCQ94617.1 conserved membrane hypothetical protein [[Clostridium] ultunense Esp]SHD76713.1 conserved membrane protein of unknown function [[Clostridium] ultunense Esp]